MTTVLVTGANRGIGLEFVRQYAADGARVIACCRDPRSAEALGRISEASAGRVRILPLDVADAESVATLKAVLGDEPVDILINNAGIGGPREQSAGKIDAQGWLQAFQVNTMGPVLIAQALHDNLARGREKKLVAITSQLGSTAGNGGGRYVYRSTKAALNNAMRGLSRDWAAEGVAVGIFHPGWVQTDMGGKGAPLTPEASVRGLRQRIAELSASTSGAYRDYAGAELPW